jgi:hypothetical protein
MHNFFFFGETSRKTITWKTNEEMR